MFTNFNMKYFTVNLTNKYKFLDIQRIFMRTRAIYRQTDKPSA